MPNDQGEKFLDVLPERLEVFLNGRFSVCCLALHSNFVVDFRLQGILKTSEQTINFVEKVLNAPSLRELSVLVVFVFIVNFAKPAYFNRLREKMQQCNS